MLFNLFGSNKKQEFIEGYAQKLADAAVEGEIDADLLEELIDYAREHDLSNKQLASAQALACDKAFEELFQNGYLDDDEYDLYKDLIDTCYMLKEDQKYKYTTISKRCNAIYKIQEKGLLPKVDPEFANVDYREGEDLHFAGPAKLMKEESGAEKLSGGVIAKGTFYKTGGPMVGESPKGWKENGPGVLWITTERIGYRGKKGKFTLEISIMPNLPRDFFFTMKREKNIRKPSSLTIRKWQDSSFPVSSTVRRKKTQKNLKNKTRNGKALQAMARQSFFLFLVFIVFL